MNWKVIRIDSKDTHQWLKEIHYAKRIPSISYAYALYIEDHLRGIVTYGTPSSSTLRNGIAGEENSKFVLELNRLVFSSPIKNGSSYLVSRSLSMLPKPTIVVSYADTEQGHVGYVYQACNFLYTGLSAKRTDWKIKGMEHLHGQTIADMSRNVSNRAQYMRDTYGDDFYLKERPRKHRYIIVVGNKYQKKELISQLKYEQQPYPKGESKRYEIEQPVSKNVLDFI